MNRSLPSTVSLGVAASNGVAAGLLTTFVVPASYELLVWIGLIVVVSLCPSRSETPFRAGAAAGGVAGVAVTLCHVFFVVDYLASHEEEYASFSEFLLGSRELTLLAMGTFYWVVLALLVGSASVGLSPAFRRR